MNFYDNAMEGDNTMNDFNYIAQVYADYVLVRDGLKPLLIVSYGKSDFAGVTLAHLAQEDGLTVEFEDLVCEDRKLHRHVFIAQAGSPYAREARDMIIDCIGNAALYGTSDERKRKLRRNLQFKLGMLLGYSAYECDEFAESDLGRTCPCDCCGSEYTLIPASAPVTDGNPGRFIENAYTY